MKEGISSSPSPLDKFTRKISIGLLVVILIEWAGLLICHNFTNQHLSIWQTFGQNIQSNDKNVFVPPLPIRSPHLYDEMISIGMTQNNQSSTTPIINQDIWYYQTYQFFPYSFSSKYIFSTIEYQQKYSDAIEYKTDYIGPDMPRFNALRISSYVGWVLATFFIALYTLVLFYDIRQRKLGVEGKIYKTKITLVLVLIPVILFTILVLCTTVGTISALRGDLSHHPICKRNGKYHNFCRSLCGENNDYKGFLSISWNFSNFAIFHILLLLVHIVYFLIHCLVMRAYKRRDGGLIIPNLSPFSKADELEKQEKEKIEKESNNQNNQNNNNNNNNNNVECSIEIDDQHVGDGAN
ncbi:hypothetical protein DFA_10451 [Cavenderia fasciculata]|uniref:Transmembrane protein n=1 Tax=Cavenderia fasciculata TaxID=261658 RepID=F4QA90_CACFS|nr:uncharacterized protein DFA_10451 [Cavenderia fasciculata]EGG15609.1 hypothetical protein DFA_10451 [Cavenderia fasciculata]|eukprot:XP_004354351.1 hypothetical protein DFA_10451 [Cavenderia fasciculata]